MNRKISKLFRIIALLALLLSVAAVAAQDDAQATASDAPFMGIRYVADEGGLLVTGVIGNTPATTSLRAGDIVSAVNGEALLFDNVRAVLWQHAPGDTVDLTVLRDGQRGTVALTLIHLPDDLFTNEDFPMPLDLAAIGLYVGQCNGRLHVIGARADSAVAVAGFRLYDRILRINGQAVASIADADIVLAGLAAGDSLQFEVVRNGQTQTVSTQVEDQRRRRRSRRPAPPRPRAIEVQNTYSDMGLTLGYGEGFIAVQALDESHALYAAGMRENDIIHELNGAPIAAAKDLFADDSIALTLARGNGSLTVDVPGSFAPLLMLGAELPSESETAYMGLHEKQVNLGLRYVQLEADSPAFAGTGQHHGALVVEVIEGLPAASAGIQVGDIITAVAGEPATLEVDLRNRIYFHEPGETVSIELLRDGELRQVPVTLRIAG